MALIKIRLCKGAVVLTQARLVVLRIEDTPNPAKFTLIDALIKLS